MRIVLRVSVAIAALVALLALAIWAIVRPPAPLALPEPGAVLEGVTLVEPGGFRRASVRLVVEGSSIERIEDAPPDAAGPFAGTFVLPGLVDMHVHFPPPTLPGQTALFAFLRWSYTGRVMRATAQDREAAAVMGIDTDRVYALTWTIGIACVGVAGVLLAPLYPVYPTAGLQFVLIAYVVVVLGGLGDMAGAVVGSLVVAAVEVVGSYAIGTAWKEVLYFLLFIGILLIRPAGLFGLRGAERLGT